MHRIPNLRCTKPDALGCTGILSATTRSAKLFTVVRMLTISLALAFEVSMIRYDVNAVVDSIKTTGL